MDQQSAASYIAQRIGNKVLDRAIDKVTDPVLSCFGLGGAPSFDAYFQHVMKALGKIQVTLDNLSERMNDIANDVAAVQAALTGISLQITDAELQSALQAYTTDANTIEQNFQTYTNLLAAMKNKNQVKDALNDLYQLFSVNNVDAVAIAMRDVHHRVVGNGELKGILSFQGSVCAQALDSWASNPGNLEVYGPRASHDPRLRDLWSFRLIDTGRIYGQWFNVYQNATADSVIPMMRAALALQTKGLMFLSAAWGRTELMPNLQTHNVQVTDTVSAMNSWWPTLNPDAAVGSSIRAHGTRLPPEANTVWLIQDSDHLHGAEVPYPFGPDWLMWVTAINDGNGYLVAGLINSPWQFGGCQAASRVKNHAGYEYNVTGDFKNYDWVIARYDGPGFSTINLPPPSASKPTPDILTNFLAGLPSTPPTA
jgi:archaellum component FlaC